MPANEPRYFVDERGGCIAVRDRTKTDPDYQGLHADTYGVVKYWHGHMAKEACPTCGHELDAGWCVAAEASEAAKTLCAELNEGANHAG